MAEELVITGAGAMLDGKPLPPDTRLTDVGYEKVAVQGDKELIALRRRCQAHTDMPYFTISVYPGIQSHGAGEEENHRHYVAHIHWWRIKNGPHPPALPDDMGFHAYRESLG